MNIIGINGGPYSLKDVFLPALIPGIKIGSIDLLDGAGRHQLLEEFNSTGGAYPESTVTELFEQSKNECLFKGNR